VSVDSSLNKLKVLLEQEIKRSHDRLSEDIGTEIRNISKTLTKVVEFSDTKFNDAKAMINNQDVKIRTLASREQV
jgi:hypothetical protein